MGTDGVLTVLDPANRPTPQCNTPARAVWKLAAGAAISILTLFGTQPTHVSAEPETTPTTPPPASATTTASTADCPPSTASGTANQPWTMRFGGDTLLTRPRAKGSNPFGGIQPSLASADLSIVNLETPLTARGQAQVKTFVFRTPTAFAGTLAANGVDVVSLANNHLLDYGTVGLTDTIEALRSANVHGVGAGANIAEALRPAQFHLGRTCVAVLAASQIIPAASWVASANHPGIASAGKHRVDANTQRLLTAVSEAKRANDVVVVVMHWGIEGDPCPSPIQVQLGAELAKAGATAVLGAHPHVLQPIVTLTDGPGRNHVIAYSMGNFIWDPRSGATADTGVLELRFAGANLTGFQFIPHRLDANGWARRVGTDTAQGAVGARIADRVARTCGSVRGQASATFAPPTTGSPATTPPAGPAIPTSSPSTSSPSGAAPTATAAPTTTAAPASPAVAGTTTVTTTSTTTPTTPSNPTTPTTTAPTPTPTTPTLSGTPTHTE